MVKICYPAIILAEDGHRFKLIYPSLCFCLCFIHIFELCYSRLEKLGKSTNWSTLFVAKENGLTIIMFWGVFGPLLDCRGCILTLLSITSIRHDDICPIVTWSAWEKLVQSCKEGCHLNTVITILSLHKQEENCHPKSTWRTGSFVIARERDFMQHRT